MTEREAVLIEGGDLHRVLEEAGSRPETGPGHVRRTRVLVRDRVADALEVEAEVIGDHEELIGGRKLDVPPGVGEELGQLRLLRNELDDLRSEDPEELRRPLDRPGLAARDDLRQRAQLLERVALGDALRAEDDVHVHALFRQPLLNHGGDAGIDRAAQHQELTVHQVAGHLVDGAEHRPDVGIEEPVHRGPDDDDDGRGRAERPAVGGGGEFPARQDLGQQLGCPLFPEGHAPAVDRLHRAGVGVLQHDRLAVVCKGDPER